MEKFSIFLLWVVAVALGYAVCDGHAAAAAPPVESACTPCHSDFTTLLPKDHPGDAGNALASCIGCHQPDNSATGKNNGFFARMHLAHLPPKADVDCLTCHAWSAGKSFGLKGSRQSWGAPTQEEIDFIKEILASWATSEFLDNRHGRAAVSCGNCHGKELPLFDASVANGKCLECHGPMERLVKKTEPPDFKDRNPHSSHLGEINCTVCHKAHSESAVYCLGCHQQFKMNIQGDGKPKQR